MYTHWNWKQDKKKSHIFWLQVWTAISDLSFLSYSFLINTSHFRFHPHHQGSRTTKEKRCIAFPLLNSFFPFIVHPFSANNKEHFTPSRLIK